MDHLPQELVDQIVASLAPSANHGSKKGLCNLRETSKYFADVVSPVLFEAIPLWLSVRSLQRLTDLSHHETTASHVREIRFSPLRLVTRQNGRETAASRLQRTLGDENPDCPDLLALLSSKVQHGKYLASQKALYSQNVAHKVLEHAFRRLPSACRINISLASHTIGAREIRSEFGTIEFHEYYWDPEMALPILYGALGALPSSVHSFRFDEEDAAHLHYPGKDLIRIDPKDSGLATLYRASDQIATKNIEYLELSYKPSEVLILGKRHTKLYIDILANFFSKCPEISYLEIHQPDTIWPGTSEDRKRLSRLFDETDFCSLKTLKLSNITFTDASHLTSIFGCSCDTLQRATLDYVQTPQDWTITLGQLRDLDLKALRSFRLLLLGEEDVIEAGPYLKRRTVRSPLIRMLCSDGDDGEDDSSYVESDSDSTHPAEYDSDWISGTSDADSLDLEAVRADGLSGQF